MKSQYRAKIVFRKPRLQPRAVLELPVRGSLNEAINDASGYLCLRRCKCANILRADCEGINAGKFFLHQILK